MCVVKQIKNNMEFQSQKSINKQRMGHRCLQKQIILAQNAKHLSHAQPMVPSLIELGYSSDISLFTSIYSQNCIGMCQYNYNSFLFFFNSLQYKINSISNMSSDLFFNDSKNPQTFRNSNVHSFGPKNQNQSIYNQTLHTSTLISNSPAKTTHSQFINCPQFPPDAIYKCQICSKLRVVCPYQKKWGTQEGAKTQTEINKNIQFNKKFSFGPNGALNQTLNKKTTEQKKQTPHFSHSYNQNKFNQHHDLGAKFANSIPYTRQSLSSKKRKGIEVIHKNNQSFTTDQRTSHHFQNIKPNLQPNLDPNRTYLRKLHSNTLVIQEIVYVPHICNVIVPEFVNPQENIYTDRTQNFCSRQENEPRLSPIRKMTGDNEHGVMTPENMRKLAQSRYR